MHINIKYLLISFSISSTILFVGCNDSINYERIATYQDNSIPELDIDVADSTRVLVIVPHADDETIAGGLIALFNDRGASIHLLMLCEHNDTRVEELNCSATNLGIEQVKYAGFINNTWEAIMEDNITFWYDHQDSIKNVISNKINAFRPNFLITYDAEIGGYGHPEHRISAELTEEIFNENRNNTAFSPEKIFQITLSEKLEEFLVSKTPGYELSKRLTGSNGLPKPDVSVDIRNYWNVKNHAARCHQSQIKILKRFYMVYDPSNEEEHKKAFSKEYYRVVK
ncbi:MAG: PIG-L deacetylase family protein [Bacteroidota bacterium]